MDMNKRGQVAGVALFVVTMAIVIAVAGPILTVVTDDIEGTTTETQRFENESRALSNASGETCSGCWTNNFSVCNRHGWDASSVVLYNTTTECAGGCLANVSSQDCAVHLNGTLQNGTYNVSYTYFPQDYINSSAYQSVATNFPVFVALMALIALIVGGFFFVRGF